MVSILSNGVDFLAIARGAYANNGIGLSASARALTQDFLNSSNELFNTLYLQAEDREANLALQINALRSSLGVDRQDVVLRSQIVGNEVDTEA